MKIYAVFGARGTITPNAAEQTRQARVHALHEEYHRLFDLWYVHGDERDFEEMKQVLVQLDEARHAI